MHTPTTFDQTNRSGTGPLAHYDSASPVTGIPSRNEIVTEFDNEMTAILQQSLSDKQPIHFMPTEVSDDTSEYVNGVSSYILRITGTLINGQKAVIKITGIRPFFDAEVLENYFPSSFKTILARILSITLKSTSKFGFEDICAYPLRGYHTEKRAYIRITTWNQDRKSTRLNSSHGYISYAVFCLKKKKQTCYVVPDTRHDPSSPQTPTPGHQLSPTYVARAPPVTSTPIHHRQLLTIVDLRLVSAL